MMVYPPKTRTVYIIVLTLLSSGIYTTFAHSSQPHTIINLIQETSSSEDISYRSTPRVHITPNQEYDTIPTELLVTSTYIRLDELTRAVDNPTPAAGTSVTYTITIKNNGPGVAGLVTATDILPAGLTYVSSSASQGTYNSTTGVWTVGQINPGNSVTLILTALVSPFFGGQTITNCISAFDAYASDPYTSNNTSCNTITVQLVADLQLTKTVDNSTPAAGTNITFTLIVKNNGPGFAGSVSVTDVLPAGISYVSSSASQGSYDSSSSIWLVGSLYPGANATLTLTAFVSPFISGFIQNCATTFDAYSSDPYLSNNTACADINIQRVADLQVFKSVFDPSNMLVNTRSN